MSFALREYGRASNLARVRAREKDCQTTAASLAANLIVDSSKKAADAKSFNRSNGRL